MLLEKNNLDKKTLISRVKKSLNTKFKNNDIEAKITGREKRVFSIYQKIKKKKVFIC